MQHLQVHVHVPNTPDNRDPVIAAQSLAGLIQSRIAADKLTPLTVAIFLQGFGHDGDVRSEDGTWTPALRFFCADDTLPGVLGFPQPGAGDLSDRAYRHPFLLNTTKAGPMLAWMNSFLAELAARHAAGQIPNPNKFLWTFDTESWIATYGGANAVKMLYEVASRQNIWETWPVPGSEGWEPMVSRPGWTDSLPLNPPPTGKTLKQLYDAHRALQAAHNVTVWPADIRDAAAGINPLLRADTTRNLAFMKWWYDITFSAQDSVMFTTAYAPIREAFPGSLCLNYDSARYDGVVDETGWWADPAADNVWTNQMPRCWIDRQPSIALYDKVNVLAPNIYERWVGIKQTTTGDLDSPYLYPQQYTQLTGFGGAIRGHGQTKIYLPPDGCYYCPPSCISYVMCPPPNQNPNVHCCFAPYCGDCGAEATKRLDRHTIESIINSAGGSETKLAVWLAQPGPVSNPSLDYYRGIETLMRHTLAMLRGKNVPRLLFWTGQLSISHLVWNHTEELVKRVYGAEVVDTKVVQGNVVDDTNVCERLEYTLRRDGAAYTLDVESAGGNFEGTAVHIEVFIKEEYRNGHDYEIIIEDSDVFGTNGEGRLYVLDHNANYWQPDPTNWASSEWRRVPTTEGTFAYGFFTPDGSSRRTFLLRRQGSEQFDANGKMTLRLVHVTNSATAFSRLDLVQVIPVPTPQSAPPPPGGGGETLQADLNYDDQVDVVDLTMFMEAFVEGAPLADVDCDNDVDHDDLMQFLNTYAYECDC